MNLNFSQHHYRNLKKLLVGEDTHNCMKKREFFNLYKEKRDYETKDKEKMMEIEIIRNVYNIPI